MESRERAKEQKWRVTFTSAPLLSLLLTTSVHEVEHQSLFVIKDAGPAIFDYLVGEVEQRGDNLEAGLVAIILLAQYLKHIRWSLISNF